jgi:hypothetical protein
VANGEINFSAPATLRKYPSINAQRNPDALYQLQGLRILDENVTVPEVEIIKRAMEHYSTKPPKAAWRSPL